ncbi:MAG TPA: hypothetical protein PLV57_07510 [Phycisphaerae bacterium]|nr:hypothetical protein [Phycisphaerae bacterium]
MAGMRCVAGLWSAIVVSNLFAVTPTEFPVLPDRPVARIVISPDVVERPVSPVFVGNNLHPGPPRIKLTTDPVVQERIKAQGFKTIRFPNGCVADLYNFKQPKEGWMTVEQFLDFCDAIDAEPYYTLNMQGGTEGREGPVPENASLEERIAYKHTAPNPCGNTDYHFGTLAESVELLQKYTIERALAGRRPILHYELGNENWGQATTDWPPLVYGKTCEVWASTLRETLADAKAKHPELTGLELYIVAVGYPCMGNNMDPFKATNHEINVAWTGEINRLAALGLIDAVQEHFYPYGNGDGSTLLWTVHNLSNILHLRHGKPNPRLGGYADLQLAYHLPLEWTEWNVKCWGPLPKTNLPLVNADFESGLKAWTVSHESQAKVIEQAARRGSKGLQLTSGNDGQAVEARQTLSITNQKTTASVGAAVWVRTDRPQQTAIIVRQANDGPSRGAELGRLSPNQINMWQRVQATGKPKEDTTEVEIVLQVTGENVTAWFDEVQPLHWATFSGVAPLVATRFEQQLFLVDTLRTLLEWPTPRTHVHHLFGNYPCTTNSVDGTDRDNAAAFRFLNGCIGDRVVKTQCEVATFNYDTNADAYATDFNALAPDMLDVPALSALTTRDDGRLHVLLVNRTSDRTIQAEIRFDGSSVGFEPKGEVRTLVGADFDTVGASVRTDPLAVAKPLVHAVPPHCAQVLTLTFESTQR